jgi:hypothetical protein
MDGKQVFLRLYGELWTIEHGDELWRDDDDSYPGIPGITDVVKISKLGTRVCRGTTMTKIYNTNFHSLRSVLWVTVRIGHYRVHPRFVGRKETPL